MAIFPGGKSTRINSPRHLTLRHSRRIIAAYQHERRRLAGISTLEEEETDPLPPGEQKLSSYWAPGLEAGPKHNIRVTQTIDAKNGDETLQLEAEQDFFVDAPQFSLPAGSVHSTYPPAGYSDDHRILPHVVLTDPHLPWERLGSPSDGTNKELRMRMKTLAAGKGGEPVRNRVPWLIMMSFSQDELRLTPQDLASDGIFRNTSPGVVKPVKQSSTMTVNMSIEDLWKLTSDVATPVTSDLGPESMKNSRGDFVFVETDLFQSFFSTFDTKGNRIPGTSPNTRQYQYMSHVRKINGSGMALAGVEDTAVFAIVVGTRSGPLDNVMPTTMCAHLVSIEGVERMAWPSKSHRYVALCSLHSWNYTVLPPKTINVPDAFEHLGRTLDVLRVPDSMIEPLRNSDDAVKKLVGRRLDDGYTLVKYHTQTGELTVALYRSPLTPSYVKPLENLKTSSNSGVDLQILDKQLGIMDVTYSVAWQVGRTMALGDEAFAAALVRLRSSIHLAATEAAKLQTLKDIDDSAFRTKSDVLGGLGGLVKNLASIHLGPRNDLPEEPGQPRRPPLYAPGGARRRWFRSRLRRAALPKLSFSSPLIRDKYPSAALKVARGLAGSTTGGVYDETNDPQSTDWMIVLSWLLDRMFLAGVPAHFLIADPNHLVPESLRFFCIDRNWIDALVDGALSLGNHFGDDEDRVAIKKILNDYIGHTPDGQDHPVQIPSYGFYLRSDLVTMFPDLRVEVLPDNAALGRAGQEPPSGAPLLRHEIVTDGIMMAFMDRLPGSAQFASLVLTQPAHQQRFAVARGLDLTQVKVDIRRQYTVEQSIRETDSQRHVRLDQVTYTPTGAASEDNIFIWGSQPDKGLGDLRILRLPRFADVQLNVLREKMPTYTDGTTEKPYFDDTVSTSALFAMQLNDPIYNLVIDLQGHPSRNIDGLGPGSAGGSETRTLRLLGAARVEKLAFGGHESATVPHEPDDEDGSQATFRRLESYIASPTALSRNLAPHVRALPTDSRGFDSAVSSVASASATKTLQLPSPSVGPASSPKYLVRIGSNRINDWDTITVEKENLAQDLVFSVVLKQSEVSQYRLIELDIQLELGPLTGSGADNHCLLQSYTGPGAHMLTNLRFNVLPSLAEVNNKNYLRLRLLPRAAKGWCNATAVNELSFLLALTSINLPIRERDDFTVQSWADYCRDPSLSLDPSNIFRILNEDTKVTTVRKY
ncbi:hypothetical protein DCS_00101 [Drechmeria coniospora]|uniref:Uncharacterized protein n=1 Tax=Drechmeria coniospora TaxID=98403 RepID=A0A151GPD4_DRECN|nr:hypothetical protein DCS_00101 [Drechmeria coniospora]KYK58974.1 hypothetical protein DCS_00101 [Drechmeria coniospora]